VIKIRVITM